MRVLIIDDYDEAVEAAELLLGILGHETRGAKTGAEALALFDSYAPALVLLDLGLPDLSGHEVAREIRRRGRPVYIAALTGWGSEADREASLAAGIDVHVIKPPTGAMLEEIIAAATARVSAPA